VVLPFSPDNPMHPIDDLPPKKRRPRGMSMAIQILAGALSIVGFSGLIWLVTHAH
jgi:hypothetical protein